MRRNSVAISFPFAKQRYIYQDAVLFVACGNAVGSVIAGMKANGVISAEVISIPHPSGVNAGRIAAFLNGDDNCVWCELAPKYQNVVLGAI